MKKLFAILLVLMLAVSGLAMAEEDTSVENILEKGTFILGLDDSFPPMGFRDENNDIVGFDIDVAKEVAARLGVEFIAQPISWDAKELELASGTIDCIWNGMSITPEREESMAMTFPYLNNQMIFYTRADAGIDSLEALAGRRSCASFCRRWSSACCCPWPTRSSRSSRTRRWPPPWRWWT